MGIKLHRQATAALKILPDVDQQIDWSVRAPLTISLA